MNHTTLGNIYEAIKRRRFRNKYKGPVIAVQGDTRGNYLRRNLSHIGNVCPPNGKFSMNNTGQTGLSANNIRWIEEYHKPVVNNFSTQIFATLQRILLWVYQRFRVCHINGESWSLTLTHYWPHYIEEISVILCESDKQRRQRRDRSARPQIITNTPQTEVDDFQICTQPTYQLASNCSQYCHGSCS